MFQIITDFCKDISNNGAHFPALKLKKRIIKGRYPCNFVKNDSTYYRMLWLSWRCVTAAANKPLPTLVCEVSPLMPEKLFSGPREHFSIERNSPCMLCAYVEFVGQPAEVEHFLRFSLNKRIFLILSSFSWFLWNIAAWIEKICHLKT